MYESLSVFIQGRKKSVNNAVGYPYRVNKVCLYLDQMLKKQNKQKNRHEPVAIKKV